MEHKPKALIAVFAVTILVVVGYVWQKGESDKIAYNSIKSVIPQDLAGGDTNNDLLRSVMARQSQNDKENKDLKQQIRLLEAEKDKAVLEHDGILAKFKSYVLDVTEKNQSSSKSYAGNGYINNEYEGESNRVENNLITEVVDISQKVLFGNGESKHSVPDDLPTANKKNWYEGSDNGKKDNSVPYITIPKLSTLSDVKLMTSIIAQVPVSGKLLSPAFPFKAILGRKDLIAANGINIPNEASGIVLEGYSVGNMSLKCARGYITSLLFVFEDGHFVSYPDKNEATATEIYPANAIGYISNEYNATCIPGEYLSNASGVIASQAAMGAVASGGKGLAQSQTTTFTSGIGGVNSLTKDVGQYLLGSSIGGASDKTLSWYNDRVADITDAIYIPATSNKKPLTLTVHVTKTINIDYDKKGRTIGHENSNQTTYLSRLD